MMLKRVLILQLLLSVLSSYCIDRNGKKIKPGQKPSSKNLPTNTFSFNCYRTFPNMNLLKKRKMQIISWKLKNKKGKKTKKTGKQKNLQKYEIFKQKFLAKMKERKKSNGKNGKCEVPHFVSRACMSKKNCEEHQRCLYINNSRTRRCANMVPCGKSKNQ